MRIIIVGHGASGKDTLKSKLLEKGFKADVSLTTRPPRDGEIDGKDYHFVTMDNFLELKNVGNIVQAQEFNGNWYGTLRSEWDSKNVFIMTPQGIAALSDEDRKSCFVMFININPSIRYDRLAERGDTESDIAKRMNEDETKFSGFNGYDMMICNPEFIV